MKFINPLKIRKVKDFKLTKSRRKKLLKFIGYSFLGIIIFSILLFVWYSKDLPTPNRIKNRKIEQATQLYDRNGKMLYAISGDQKRIMLEGDKIPDVVKNATVAIEDQKFYHHIGIDFRSFVRAVLTNLTARSYAQGGSTITQQLVKNALLSPKKTISRKIKELILSLELEAIYSKKDILTMYLNEIPYGSTVYGIEAASQTFLGKYVGELTLAEAAVLAALPQAPSYFSPYGSNVEKLMTRKDRVLDDMVKMSYVTQEEADTAKKDKISFVPKKDSILAPHFVFYIQELLEEKYGKELVSQGGLKVTTTLDLDVQGKAQQAIDDNTKKLDRYDATNASLVAIKPGTGEVLAMVGSKDYFNNDIQGQVNITTSQRQPGSSFKPIVYATGFKEKYNPAFVLYDLKTDFGNYSPDNYNGSFSGPVTIRHALSNSLNIPAVKMLGLVGLKNALQTASDLGITTLNDPDRYGLALVLGGGEVMPIEMANAFAVFGNQGKYAPVNPILKVELSDGEVMEENKPDEYNPKQVLDDQIAFMISDILSDNQARSTVFGFSNNLAFTDRKVAVKTGTTQEFRDAWTVGYTPQISTAVWVGNADNKAMNKGADGSVVAAPIWHQFMKEYLKDKPVENFTRPDGVKQVKVDKLSNKLPSDYSPETVFDWFASWQIPNDVDDIHIKVKVNRMNGKLATSDTPANLVDEVLYSNIHSEKPDNSNWENPVIAWAEKNGLFKKPPTDKDDMYSSGSNKISFSSPTDNQNLGGAQVLKVNITNAYSIESVRYAIDGVEVASSTAGPNYETTYDFSQLPLGSHTLVAIATDQNDVTFSTQISVNTSDNQAPEISNIKILPTSTSSTITFSSNENSVSYINYSTNQTSLSSKTSSELNSRKEHSIIIPGLTANTKYYFQIICQDGSGNSASSSAYSFTTLP
ncbi:MAG: Penicillin-binding protein, 1A family [Berkelbacteria bacterium GW2011_GWA2_35_9]|uniref:Penicillin-binding protein, 1A family n=1 Tax=Berkelbacteria bacterium GW2011_GWA2_35_9 TaxID=1618333 RepID=A0A0G0DJA8_9BACT|nr:MAG: Penicillin-binding protein, 1A family [Berkelbacteria bacterium GW2011_GWA2_35_9]